MHLVRPSVWRNREVLGPGTSAAPTRPMCCCNLLAEDMYVRCSLDDPTPQQVASGGGAHEFFGQQGRLLLASPRDPLRYNIHRWKNGRDSGLRVDTPKGHMDLSPARYAYRLTHLLPSVLIGSSPACLTVSKTAC